MSTIRVDNVGPSAGGTVRDLVRGTAAAWANLNGTGTISLRDSINISSVTDNSTGNYTFNYANAMLNINYSLSAIPSNQPATAVNKIAIIGDNTNAPSTNNSGDIISRQVDSTTVADTERMMYQCFGSLA